MIAIIHTRMVLIRWILVLVVLQTVSSHADLGTGDGAVGMDRRRLLQQELSFVVEGDSFIGQASGDPGQALGKCSLPRAQGTVQIQCWEDLVCVPVLSPPQRASHKWSLERSGLCVAFPGNAAYIFDSDADMPVPVGYFPLVGGNLNSWPFDTYLADFQGVTFQYDDVFGEVAECKEGSVVLPPVNYAAEGGFAVSLWFKKHGMDGIGFEYLFSHMINGALPSVRKPSQIQLYFMKNGNPKTATLRAVVKDHDDVAVGELADVFLDTDGQMESKKVDFADGKWHMATVTTHPDKSKGFALYLDGERAAEIRPNSGQYQNGNKQTQLVPGGDSIDLTGNLHLCTRAIEPADRYYEGKMAHLLLFSTPLSEEEVLTLYESFFTTKSQMDRTKKQDNASKCAFPAVSRGESVIGCIQTNGTLSCPMKPGKWAMCPGQTDKPSILDESEPKSPPKDPVKRDEKKAPDNEDNEDDEPKAASRQLPKKEPKKEPKNVPKNATNEDSKKEAVFFSEKRAKEVQRFEKKSSKSKGAVKYTETGDQCVFPSFYGGKIVEDCIEISGSPMCRVQSGDWEKCVDKAPKNSNQDGKNATENEEAQYPIRRTHNNEACVFPFTYANRTYEDCGIIADIWSCRVESGELQQCVVERDPNSIFALNRNATILSRITEDGEQCMFPYWYDGKSLGDCYPDVRSTAGRCPDKKGGSGLCKPLRLTIHGEPCAIPFFHEGVIHKDCMEYGEWEVCKVADGSFYQCAPLGSEVGMNQSLSGQFAEVTGRVTVDGSVCAFPFWFNGKLVSTCVPEVGAEGEFCRTMDGLWEECVPVRHTVSGATCSLPFFLDEESMGDCALVNGTYQCMTSSGHMEDCNLTDLTEGNVSTPIPEPSSEIDMEELLALLD